MDILSQSVNKNIEIVQNCQIDENDLINFNNKIYYEGHVILDYSIFIDFKTLRDFFKNYYLNNEHYLITEKGDNYYLFSKQDEKEISISKKFLSESYKILEKLWVDD